MYLRSLLLLFGLSFVIGSSAAFTSSDTYLVRNIQVDAKAESAVAAQQRALADGRMKAFQILASRLSGYDETPDFDGLTNEKLEDLVLDYEVKKQKNSAVRYIATLDFRFDKAAVKKFMTQQNFSGKGTRKDSLVIVPVLETASQHKLWESDNPWFTAWANQKHFRSAHPIIIPMGDLTDISEVVPEQAITQDIDALHQLARRYGAGGALVAVANELENGDVRINITLTTLEGTFQNKTITIEHQKNGSSNSAIWSQAIEQTITTLKELGRSKPSEPVEPTFAQTKSDDYAQSEAATPPANTSQPQLIVTVPLASLNTWMHVQRVLKDVSPINKVQLKSMSSTIATIEIKYSGSLPALESALSARGLQLSQGTDSRWILSTNTNPNTYNS